MVFMNENKIEFKCLGKGPLKPALLRKSVEPERLLSKMPVPKASFLGSDVGNPHPLIIDLNKPQEKRLGSQEYKCSLSFSIFHSFMERSQHPHLEFPITGCNCCFFLLPAIQIIASFLPLTVSRGRPRQVNSSSRRKQRRAYSSWNQGCYSGEKLDRGANRSSANHHTASSSTQNMCFLGKDV